MIAKIVIRPMFNRSKDALSSGRQTYRWDEITRIEKYPNFGPFTGKRSVWVYRGRFGICFSEFIGDFDELTAAVDRYAVAHKIPVLIDPNPEQRRLTRKQP